MPSHAITTLEFDRLKETLLQLIRTPLGASLVEDLEIFTDAEEIRRNLRLTGEGVLYLRDGTAHLMEPLEITLPRDLALSKTG